MSIKYPYTAFFRTRMGDFFLTITENEIILFQSILAQKWEWERWRNQNNKERNKNNDCWLVAKAIENPQPSNIYKINIFRVSFLFLLLFLFFSIPKSSSTSSLSSWTSSKWVGFPSFNVFKHKAIESLTFECFYLPSESKIEKKFFTSYFFNLSIFFISLLFSFPSVIELYLQFYDNICTI